MDGVPPTDRQRHRYPGLALVVAFSLGFGLCAIAFYQALEATPWDTRDSAGNTMGFNDPFSVEHYESILGNVSFTGALAAIGGYELLLIAAHLTMGAMLWGGAARPWVLAFCAFQPAVFFWGIAGLLYMPWDLATLPGKDREGFIDVPWVELITHGAWLYACIVIAIRVWPAGPGRCS